jgi:hypothetical protein
MSARRASTVVQVPAARGRRPREREGTGSFAVLVTGVDQTRAGRAAIEGPRVRPGSTVTAKVGTLLFVYGEDRAPWDGSLLFVCADLYRIGPRGELVRLDFGTLDRGEWWEPVVLSIAAELAEASDGAQPARPTAEQPADPRPPLDRYREAARILSAV